jgi:hypothetical protein
VNAISISAYFPASITCGKLSVIPANQRIEQHSDNQRKQRFPENSGGEKSAYRKSRCGDSAGQDNT